MPSEEEGSLPVANGIWTRSLAVLQLNLEDLNVLFCCSTTFEGIVLLVFIFTFKNCYHLMLKTALIMFRNFYIFGGGFGHWFPPLLCSCVRDIFIQKTKKNDRVINCWIGNSFNRFNKVEQNGVYSTPMTLQLIEVMFYMQVEPLSCVNRAIQNGKVRYNFINLNGVFSILLVTKNQMSIIVWEYLALFFSFFFCDGVSWLQKMEQVRGNQILQVATNWLLKKWTRNKIIEKMCRSKLFLEVLLV